MNRSRIAWASLFVTLVVLLAPPSLLAAPPATPAAKSPATKSAADETPQPPVAPRIGHRQSWHGEEVTDHYYWLREKSNPAVIDYLKAENAYTEALTRGQKSLEETLYQEMLGRIKQTDLSVPVRRGPYEYYDRTEEGQQYPISCRRKLDPPGAEEVLLNANELAKGKAFFALGAFEVSDDQQWLAYTTDTTGFRQYELHVKSLATGETHPDTAQRVTSVQWSADNKTLFYTTEDEVNKRSNQLWRHARGAADNKLVYEETDELYGLGLSRTSDKKFLLLECECFDAGETRCLPADKPQDTWRVLLPRVHGHRYGVDHRAGLFYLLTNRDAKNFRIVTAPDDDPANESRWQTFVPHREDVLLRDIDLLADYAVVLARSEALNHIRTYDFATGKWHDIAFPEPVYTASFGENEEFTATTYRYVYQSPVTPASVFDFDLKSHASALRKREEINGYDATQYECARLWATARDGTRVPLSVVYKKGIRHDGRTPLYLYGYGSYGAGLPATFSSDRVSLFDRGLVFALAHVRGGNELGEVWRDAGQLMKKKNTFTDFVDCAEYLVQEKWTSPDRLVIEGASAGGLLMGAVVNMRPDLFRAVHLGVPFVDVMNTMMDPSIPLTTIEYLVWGNPNEKQAFDYIRSYSPYDNLARGDYPAMLVTGSLNDSQVMYWEPAKYVAKLRTLKTDGDPLLLRMNMGAGHGGASGRYDALRETAFEYAWLLTQVGIDK
ncbi:MAG: S9 family peptidase [Pirellulales bacterium]